MQAIATGSEHKETVAWESAHYEEPFHSQRTAKLPSKLTRLGVLGLDPRSRLLDACCGKGEALDVLRQRGFTDLAGADGFKHAEWARLAGCRFASCDVRELPFADDDFDAVINLHALHHMSDARGVSAFLTECFRVLKPGGKLFILDFPGSLQIKALFYLLRMRFGVITPGLRNFAKIVDEEWSYLSTYLRDWPATEAYVNNGTFKVERWKRGFFLYYLTLSKPCKD